MTQWSISIGFLGNIASNLYIMQEKLKAAEAKRVEKERTEKYQKLKGEAKDARAKYREKVTVRFVMLPMDHTTNVLRSIS